MKTGVKISEEGASPLTPGNLEGETVGKKKNEEKRCQESFSRKETIPDTVCFDGPAAARGTPVATLRSATAIRRNNHSGTYPTIIALMGEETPIHPRSPALCPSCGYDVRASIGGRTSGRIRCPECGDVHRIGDVIRPQPSIQRRWPVVIFAIAPGPAMLLLAQLIALLELDNCMMLVLVVLMTVVHAVGLIFIAAPRSHSQLWFTAIQATLLCLLAAILDGLAIWACTRAVLGDIALM